MSNNAHDALLLALWPEWPPRVLDRTQGQPSSHSSVAMQTLTDAFRFLHVDWDITLPLREQVHRYAPELLGLYSDEQFDDMDRLLVIEDIQWQWPFHLFSANPILCESFDLFSAWLEIFVNPYNEGKKIQMLRTFWLYNPSACNALVWLDDLHAGKIGNGNYVSGPALSEMVDVAMKADVRSKLLSPVAEAMGQSHRTDLRHDFVVFVAKALDLAGYAAAAVKILSTLEPFAEEDFLDEDSFHRTRAPFMNLTYETPPREKGRTQLRMDIWSGLLIATMTVCQPELDSIARVQRMLKIFEAILGDLYNNEKIGSFAEDSAFWMNLTRTFQQIMRPSNPFTFMMDRVL